jgi:hypothetical protein
MKLKMLREHYRNKKGSESWVPKQSFNSEQEVREAGFPKNRWRVYRCRICSSLHIVSSAKVYDEY